LLLSHALEVAQQSAGALTGLIEIAQCRAVGRRFFAAPVGKE
jgi:hypothetical protein